ncbi:hypothetical protein GEMRC1_002171 [Eukaryota sp. GEM-RC1]
MSDNLRYADQKPKSDTKSMSFPDQIDPIAPCIEKPILSSTVPPLPLHHSITERPKEGKKCLQFQQSLLVLIHLHLLRRYVKSFLDANHSHSNPRSLKSLVLNIHQDLIPFFKKVGFVSDRFMESSLLAAKLFVETTTFPVIPNDLCQLVSLASFFGTRVQSIFLKVDDTFKARDFLCYSEIISGLELNLKKSKRLGISE